MRSRILSAFISILITVCIPSTVLSLEIEAQRDFGTGMAPTQVKVISTADADIFAPIIEAFRQDFPEIGVSYTVVGSQDLNAAIRDPESSFDLAISSAMDLQTQLANDGYAQAYTSAATALLPSWASWRDLVFGFTQEPAVIVISERAFGATPPENRHDLIDLLRHNPGRFANRIGTYDIRDSGLGYLFATQDSRYSESYWRLTELMGQAGAKLYCCSGEMILDVLKGDLDIAYNVLGSYAKRRLADEAGAQIIEPDDYTHVMQRTAIIPTDAQNVQEAGLLIDFLVTLSLRPELTRETGLAPIPIEGTPPVNVFQPIRLGPGLLVFLDRLKKQSFLESWQNAIQ